MVTDFSALHCIFPEKVFGRFMETGSRQPAPPIAPKIRSIDS
jgi:hypothetical protein